LAPSASATDDGAAGVIEGKGRGAVILGFL